MRIEHIVFTLRSNQRPIPNSLAKFKLQYLILRFNIMMWQIELTVIDRYFWFQEKLKGDNWTLTFRLIYGYLDEDVDGI